MVNTPHWKHHSAAYGLLLLGFFWGVAATLAVVCTNRLPLLLPLGGVQLASSDQAPIATAGSIRIQGVAKLIG